MVYMSGSKMARNAASITNLPTCGGTAKKAGTGPRVGFFLSSQPFLLRVPQGNPRVCIPSFTIQTQKYGYRATIGGNMG
jgi:hypothetical protein